MPKSEQGVNRQRYQVIPRSLIFITDGDKVLLLKGAAHKRLWANKYNGIGGHIEIGEDVYHGALRELKEEAGIEVQPLRLCGSIMIDAGENIGIHLFVFTGIFKGGMLQQSDEGELEWIAMGKILEYPLVEDLKIILPAILKTENGQMIYAHYSYNDQDEMQINYRVV
jgi:8-oxo-dGTP diphosphatase